MIPRFLFTRYAVIAAFVIIGLFGPRTSFAKPSPADLLPVEAQPPPPHQMYSNSSSLQALGNSNQAYTTVGVSNASERVACGERCVKGVTKCKTGCECKGTRPILNLDGDLDLVGKCG